MEDKGHKKIKTEKVRYQTEEELVHKVKVSPQTIKPGEVVDIDIDCPDGFSVFIPFPMFFGDQVFDAVPVPPKDITQPAKDKWWRVQLTRTNLPNPNANKELAYCIYMKDLDNFAVASSPPKMNLNP